MPSRIRDSSQHVGDDKVLLFTPFFRILLEHLDDDRTSRIESRRGRVTCVSK